MLFKLCRVEIYIGKVRWRKKSIRRLSSNRAKSAVKPQTSSREAFQNSIFLPIYYSNNCTSKTLANWGKTSEDTVGEFKKSYAVLGLSVRNLE